MLRLKSSFLLVSTLLFACAGPQRVGTGKDAKPGDPLVSHVELVIANVSKSDAEALRGQLLAQGDISNLVLKSYAKTAAAPGAPQKGELGVATYELDLRGCECELPAKVARIRSPGMRYEGRTTTVSFTAFDNQKPQIAFVHPETEGREVSDPNLMVAVEVRDSDLKSVTVNGIAAARIRDGGNVFTATITLQSGTNKVTVKATDSAGNDETRDTTVKLVPPSSDPALRYVVEGAVKEGSKVWIEGNQVIPDAHGKYSTTVTLRKDQHQVEIIVIDPEGRKTVTLKELGK